jgi:hypothetical protein
MHHTKEKSHMATRTMTRRHKLLAFGPALVMIGLTAVVASGASIIPGATAANTITVNGTVSAGMSVTSDTTSACTGGTNAIADIGDFSDGAFHSAPGCTVSFASNSTNGADVEVSDNDGTAPFFKTGAGGTDNTELDNVTNAAGGAALADDTFGIALTATGGTPAPAAGTNFTIDATPTGAETIWGALGAGAQNICGTTAVTTATQNCDFVFGVDSPGTSGGQTAGSYTGTALVVATVNP